LETPHIFDYFLSYQFIHQMVKHEKQAKMCGVVWSFKKFPDALALTMHHHQAGVNNMFYQAEKRVGNCVEF